MQVSDIRASDPSSPPRPILSALGVDGEGVSRTTEVGSPHLVVIPSKLVAPFTWVSRL